MPESKKDIQVSDRVTEISMLMNNILTGVMVMLLGWVGVSINDLKDEVAKQNTSIAVAQVNLDNLRAAYTDHIVEDARTRELVNDLYRQMKRGSP